MSTIVVAVDFSPFLGGRYEDDGEFSGEEFLRDKLLPATKHALQTGQPLTVNFDGVAGMPTSFLEEAFGGLVLALPDVGIEKLKKLVLIEAPDSPDLWDLVGLAVQFMDEAVKRR